MATIGVCQTQVFASILVLMFSLAQNYLTRGFWGDEAWTSMISQLPYTQMLKTTAADFHPPGYYTIIEILYKFAPHTEIVTRLVSIFFFLLTVWMAYLLAKRFKGQTFGLLSAAVVAVNPIFFTYAFEARNYTMFAFAATASVYFLLGLCEKFSKRNAILFVLFTLLGMYTHYYMLFVLAAEGLFILMMDRKIIWKMIGLYTIVGLLFLPWIPFLFGQIKSAGQSYWIGSINIRTHYEALMRILSGEHENIFRPFLFWLSFGLLVIGLLHHILRRKFENAYILIWLWALVPFILAALPGLKIEEFKLPFRPIFFWRYLIGSSVPLSLLIVHSAQRLSFNLYKPAVICVIVLSLGVDFLTFQRFPKTFKQVYQNQVIGQIKPEDKIVTVLPSFAEVFYYRNYFGLKNELIVLPEGLVQFSGKSLLDTYAQDGTVKVTEKPSSGRHFELRPGPKLVVSGK